MDKIDPYSRELASHIEHSFRNVHEMDHRSGSSLADTSDPSERIAFHDSEMAFHETFFIAVQASCYILCFHGTEMAATQRLTQSLKSDWERVLKSPLEPLKFSLHSVRFEFCKLAKHAGIDTVVDSDSYRSHDSHRDTNEHVGSSETSSRMNLYSRSNPLDSFFPFDPCILRMLRQAVEPEYRYWTCALDAEGYLDDESISDDDFSASECSESRNKIECTNRLAHARSSKRGFIPYGSNTSGCEGDMSSAASSLASSLHGENMAISLPNSFISDTGDGFIRSMHQQQMNSAQEALNIGRSDAVVANSGGPLTEPGTGTLGPSLQGGVDLGGSFELPVRRPRQYSITSTG